MTSYANAPDLPILTILIAIWVGALIGFVLGAAWVGRRVDDIPAGVVAADLDLHLVMNCNKCGTVGTRHVNLADLKEGVWTPMALGEPLSPLASLVKH